MIILLFLSAGCAENTLIITPEDQLNPIQMSTLASSIQLRLNLAGINDAHIESTENGLLVRIKNPGKEDVKRLLCANYVEARHDDRTLFINDGQSVHYVCRDSTNCEVGVECGNSICSFSFMLSVSATEIDLIKNLSSSNILVISYYLDGVKVGESTYDKTKGEKALIMKSVKSYSSKKEAKNNMESIQLALLANHFPFPFNIQPTK